ncbi:DNA polymerase III subunit alpha [Vibrio fluvialis]|uniref:DNA polymerase III subunit alpha n=1 Tax=Vibrio fluvialis TaxID=676 RepID=UPI003D0EBBAD
MYSLINTRSSFSMGRSILSVKEIVKQAHELGYKQVAMLDDASISGMTTLFEKVRELEEPIKAVMGVNILVCDDPLYRPPSKKSGEKVKKNESWEAKLYVKNEAGLKALFRLLTIANSEEYFYYVPRIGIKELVVALKSDGLILSTGDFFPLFQHSNYEKIHAALVKHVDASNRFIELIPARSAYFDKINKIASQIALESDTRVIFSRPVLYKEGEDDARDVMSYIMGRGTAKSRLRNIPYIRDFTMQTPEQLSLHCRTMLDNLGLSLVDSTQDIFDACSYEWTKQPMNLPQMAEDEFGELVRLCKEGWKDRFERPIFGYLPPREKMPEYKDRLEYELKVLKDMDFVRYFLLVRDVIMFSKSNNILVGPARGSAAGSLIAYLIGITDVDPLRFGLIFERFLNPDRLDYPDIDTDFMSSRRGEVIEYMTKKYGEDRVAGINNYTTIATAGAIRDVGRMFELSQDELKCTRVIDAGMSMAEAKELPEIARFAANNPVAFRIAEQLDGSMRSLGRHAAGVVVAGEPLENRAVVERRKGEQSVCWDKRTVEDWGLIKLDILGLSTLDIIQIAKEKIKARHKKELDLLSIPLDDEKVLQMFAEGKTVGVFQFTSGGMRTLLKSLSEGGRKLTFEDVYAATALYRPGPLQSGMTEEYVKIKQGIVKPHYEHPKMEPALIETRGIIVYQEQVMQIARDLCGYTMGESDKLRKVMGKKLPEEMEKQRGKFVAGAVKHSGMDESHASHLFDQIAEFAGYGFNKSHSVAYTLISYICQYLKCYYPAEFFAASLSVVKEDALLPIVKDAAECGVYVVPPCINNSTDTFEIGYDEKREQHILYAPLNRVKQVSEKGTQMILQKRKEAGGKFLSRKHFLDCIEKRHCNKRAQDNLEAVGAFHVLEPETLDPRHPDRLKDQKELIPNLMLNNVKASRWIDVKTVKADLVKLCQEIEAEGVDEEGFTTDVVPVIPNFGARPKFMMITDCASYSEEQGRKFADGKSFGYTKSALEAAGLKKSDGYYTGVVKAKKKDKQLTAEEINRWAGYLERELELLKPSVIIAAGGAAIRALCPDVKGGWEALAGQVVYDVKRDCSIYFAPNPQMVFVKPDVQNILDEIFINVAEALS